MLRRLLIPLVLVAVALAAAAGGNARPAVVKHKLVGEVGPGFKIEVQSPAGKDVKTTKAGLYTFHIEDKSTSHNFHLTGPGVNKSTAVAFQGEKDWTVTLKPGTYRYQCDPHASFGMKGSFRVTR